MNPNPPRQNSLQRLALSVLAILAVPFVCLVAYEALATPPVITISQLSSNHFSITITNAASTNYTLLWTPSLGDVNYPWAVVTNGSLGQTNFTVDTGVWPIGFFQVLTGDDTDLDTIPTWMDADPLNSAIGALQVRISTPTNGASFQ